MMKYVAVLLSVLAAGVAGAEGYPELDRGVVCGMELILSRWASMNGEGIIDLFVYDHDVSSDNPGRVLSSTVGIPVSGVAYWPSVSTLEFDTADAEVQGRGVFVGYWPRSFVGAPPQFGCAYDENGPGGVPRTNIAPGIGWPTGWHNLTVVGYDIVAWGISPWVASETSGVPEIGERFEATSWGVVKALYH